MNLCALSLIPAIGLLVPFLFVWSINTQILYPKSFFWSSCLLLIAAGMLFGINYLVCRWLSRISSMTLRRFLIGVYISGTFALVAFFVVNLHLAHQRSIYACCGFAFILLLVCLKKENVALIFLILMLAISSVRLFVNIEGEATSIGYTDEKIIFKTQPNIYLYWLESYHDFDFQQSVYGIDTGEFNAFLLHDNFTILQNIYSSAEYTLLAFSQLYSGRYMVQRTPYFDVLATWRYLIGGNEDNFVLRTLKNNGYRTCILTKNPQDDLPSGYFLFPGKHLDDTDFDKDSLEFLLQPIGMVTFSSRMKDYMEYIDGSSAYSGDLFSRVKEAMRRAQGSDQPLFLAFKGGAHHTPMDHDLSQRKAWISSGYYQNLIKESDKEAEKILSYIIQHDPGSIIILMGDHGAWSYRPAPVDNETELQKYGATKQEVIDDLFRVLLAYRLQNGEKYDLTKGMYMNNLTLFYHIFSYLADNPQILLKRPEPILEYKGFKMRDGKVVQ